MKLLLEDFRQKAQWVYGDTTPRSFLKAVFTDGSLCMVAYRVHRWLRRWHMGPIGALVLKCNSFLSQAVIGRGAQFGPGFVILHSTGIVINSRVQGGRNLFIEHGVTIGEEKGGVPILGDNIFIGAGAKIFGEIRIGNRTRIGANAVVIRDVPEGATAVGVPARIIQKELEPTS